MKRVIKVALLSASLLVTASSYAVTCTAMGPLGGMWTKHGAGTGDKWVAKSRALEACENGKQAAGRCRIIRCDYNSFKEGFYWPGH